MPMLRMMGGSPSPEGDLTDRDTHAAHDRAQDMR
jgi:hypothetical protein